MPLIATRGGFVGRAGELEELHAGLESAFRGQGTLFLIAGEPGVGKTALAGRLAEDAAERGARVLWSRSWEGGGAAPYWTWAQIIRGMVEELDDETLRAALTPRTAHIVRIVPELADRLGEAADAARAGRVADSDATRFYLFQATSRFLGQAASERPLVLVLDDLLAGDRPSLQLLRFLSADLRSSRILVVATYREAEGSRPDHVELIADLVREGYLLALRGLERQEVGRMIAEVADVVPWEGKVAAIHRATAGNPLFVREVTRLVAAVDPLDRPGRLSIPVPESARAVIRRRLALLSADAIQVLSAAAVVGSDFDLALVGAACDLPPERALASLSGAVGLGIVGEAPESAGTYRFTHPLMREAIYEGLPIGARTQMHERVGEAIERLYAADPASRLGELAYHFSKVAALGRSAEAADYARRAGDRAMESSAYEEAEIQYRRALDAMTLGGADPAERCELLLRLGRARVWVGDYPGSKATFQSAAELARELGDAERLAMAAIGFGEPQVEGGVVDRRLVGLLREAIDRLGPEDHALRVRAVARLSLEFTFADEPALRESLRDSLSREAVQMARRLDDVGALVSALRARWLAVWGPDGLDERCELSDEIVELAGRTGDREVELLGRARRITCAMEAADGAAAAADLAAYSRLAGELRIPYHEWAVASMRAGRALLAGAFAEVEAVAEAARARLPERPNASHAYMNQLTLLRWEQGRLGELRDTWLALLDRFPQLEFGRGWLCLAEADAGRDGAARAALRALLEAVPDLPRDGLWMTTLALGALGCARLEEPDAAAELYPLLLPYTDRAIVIPMPHPALCLGSAALYAGLLAGAMSDWDAAERQLETAIRVNGDLGARPFLVRARCELAGALLRRGRTGDRERALGLLERTAPMAAAVGMPRVLERVESLREGASGVAKARPPAVARGAADLHDLGDEPPLPPEPGRNVFRREGEYWTVIYQGSVVRLRDTKGLRCLSRLLAHPGRQILAVDLEAWDAGAAGASAGAAGANAEGGGKPDRGGGPSGLGVRPDLGDAGAMLDAEAKRAYKERLDELRAEVEEAESFHDSERAATAKEEIEFLTRELARAVGLGGRDRRAAAHSERARLNVTRAIKTALRRLAEDHPTLGDHLERTVRTGRTCAYTPDPRAPIAWET